MPVPRPTRTIPCRRRASSRSPVALAAVDDRFTDWAAEVGVPVGSVSAAEPARRSDRGTRRPGRAAVRAERAAGGACVRDVPSRLGLPATRLDAVLAHYEVVEGPGMTDHMEAFPPVFATNRAGSRGDGGRGGAPDAGRHARRVRRRHRTCRSPRPTSTPDGVGLLARRAASRSRGCGCCWARSRSRSRSARSSPARLTGRARWMPRWSRHESWLAAERDLMGFTAEASAAAQRLLGVAALDRRGRRAAGGGAPLHAGVPARQGVHRRARQAAGRVGGVVATSPTRGCRATPS